MKIKAVVPVALFCARCCCSAETPHTAVGSSLFAKTAAANCAGALLLGDELLEGTEEGATLTDIDSEYLFIEDEEDGAVVLAGAKNAAADSPPFRSLGKKHRQPVTQFQAVPVLYPVAYAQPVMYAPPPTVYTYAQPQVVTLPTTTVVISTSSGGGCYTCY